MSSHPPEVPGDPRTPSGSHELSLDPHGVQSGPHEVPSGPHEVPSERAGATPDSSVGDDPAPSADDRPIVDPPGQQSWGQQSWGQQQPWSGQSQPAPAAEPGGALPAQYGPPPSDPYGPPPGDPYGPSPGTPHGPPYGNQYGPPSGNQYGQNPPTGQGYPPQAGYDPHQQYAAGQQGYPQTQQGYPQAQQGYQAQPYPGQPPLASQRPLSVSDEKLWATLSHLSISFIGVVGPLVVFLVLKDRGQFVRAHAIESLNFSILYTVAQFVSGMLTAALIGYVLLPIVLVGALVLCILAGIAANKGEPYRYPVNWRLVK